MEASGDLCAKMALCWLMLALLGAILAHLGALGLHLVGKLSQDGTQDGVKMVLRWRYAGSCWRSWAISWLILGLLSAILPHLKALCRHLAAKDVAT